MSGLFPSNGVVAGQTSNGILDPDLVTGATALWYKQTCNTRIDPTAQNALISEVVNAVNDLGYEYDPSKVDNLGSALGAVLGTKNAALLPIILGTI